MSDELKPCPFCLAEIPTAARRCRHCTADLDTWEPPSLGALWIAGIVLCVIGSLIGSGDDGEWFGWFLFSVGAVVLQICIIALGVSLGVRDRDWKAVIGPRRENS
ncbi:hypothetical protein [Nocardioides marmorisolisilvae]|nr:hypothetical protein [Nocardioides marmorisolisilvae]